MKQTLLHEIRSEGLYDGYGTCMAWLFAIADYQSDNGIEVNPDWEYRQAMAGSDTDSWEYQTLAELKPSTSDLEVIANILWRYRSLLKAANKDY